MQSIGHLFYYFQMEQHLWRVRDAAALRAHTHALRSRATRGTRPAVRSPLARSSSSPPVTQSSPPLGTPSPERHSEATLARARFESIHALLDSSSSLPSSPTPLQQRKRAHEPEEPPRRVHPRVDTPVFPATPYSTHCVHAPRTPESPHSLVLSHYARTRLLGQETPRTPGGTWSERDSASDFSLPAIQVSPPPCEIDAVITRSALSHTERAGQRDYAAALLAADHAALERLTWRIDLAMAGLACADDTPRTAAHAAQSTAALLMDAWNPTSPAVLASSPASLRMNPDVGMPSGSMLSNSTHLAARYRALGAIGGETAQSLATHIANTIWYMAVRDPRRTFARPCTLAEYVSRLTAHLAQWETLEESMHARTIPVHHVADIYCCNTPNSDCAAALPVSAMIRRLVPMRLRQLFSNALDGQFRASLLAVHAPSAVSVVDAARFLGELFRRHSTVDLDCVTTWLDQLLGEPPVPAHIEGACAVLLLAYPQLQRRFVCHSQRMCSSPNERRCLLDELVARLVQVSTCASVSPQLADSIKVCVY